MTLSQWIDDLDPVVSGIVLKFVRKLGFETVEKFPPLQIRLTSSVTEEILHLRPYLGPFLLPSPTFSSSLAQLLVPLRTDHVPLLVVSLGFHRETPAQKLLLLGYTLALVAWYDRYRSENNRISSISAASDRAFFIAAHQHAYAFGFSQFLEEIVKDDRKAGLTLLQSQLVTQLLAALEADGAGNGQTSEHIPFPFLEFLVQAEGLKSLGIDLWHIRLEDETNTLKPLADLLDENYGPEWRRLVDHGAFTDSFEAAWANRQIYRELLEKLENPTERKLKRAQQLTDRCGELVRQGLLEEALDLGEEALVYLRTTSQITLLVCCLGHVHAAYAKKGDWIQACRYYAEAREVAILANDQEALAQLSMNQAASDWPDPDFCLPKLLEALQAFNRRPTGKPVWIEGKASCLEQLTSIYLCTGNQTKALQCMMELNTHKAIYHME